MSSSCPEPACWEKLATEVRLKTRILDVTSVQYRHGPRSRVRDFTVITAPDWVNVVALTPQHHLVLVRQFRFGIDKVGLEIPGGVIEENEDPVVAGLRELREETGYEGSGGRLLGSVHPNPAFQTNRCHLVLVEDATKVHELDWDEDEEIQVLTKPVEEVFALGRNGGITHALVLNALWLFEPRWAEIARGGHA